MTVITKERPSLSLPAPERPRRLGGLGGYVTQIEERLARVIRPFSLTALRLSLGVVFIWFGALKVFDATPVADLVAKTVPFLDRDWFVPALGAVEVALGIALIAGRYLTIVSAILVGHLAGTFLVLVTQPEIAFDNGNPLMLTTIGEFVVKNVVLICAALVLASRLRGRHAGSA